METGVLNTADVLVDVHPVGSIVLVERLLSFPGGCISAEIP